MTTQRRTAVVASTLVLLGFALLAGGCTGVFENSQSGLGFRSDCIRVKTGEWEFDLSTGGVVFLSFVEGDLTQSGCHLSYDEDRVFQGSLSGSIWSVSSDAGGFSLIGSFSGNPATTFSGTFIDLNNNPAAMSGRYVVNDPSGQEENDFCRQEFANFELPSGVSRADARATCFQWSNMTDVRFERLFNSAQGIHDSGCTVSFYASLIRCTSTTGGEAWEMACGACFLDIAAAVWN